MHENALTDIAKKLFPHLARFKNFYLVGGTALALQIGHRLSVDFDMFTESSSLPDQLFQRVKCVYKGRKLIVTYRTAEQLNLLIDGVKFTFFSYSYSPVHSFIYRHKVPLASIIEIAAMKAQAIGRRLAYKDYVDWYFLLKEKHVSIHTVIACAEKKFNSDFNSRLFLGQLVSFDDVPLQKIDFLGKEVSRSTIELFLKKAVKVFLKKH